MTTAEEPRLVVGLMSGTSCDGVDAVVVALRGGPAGVEPLRVEVLEHRHAPYEAAFRARLLALPDARVDEVARLHVELGRRFGEAAREALAVAGVAPERVAAVSSVGHTAVHLPPTPGDPGATLALGDGDVIAEVTGCRVLSDLRARAGAAGGQGAPLVPFADACLLREPGRVRAALNLGGIANVTVVPPDGPPIAFDTGPANMLLDGALARATGGEVAFDEGGRLGLAGTADDAWVRATLAADDFVAAPPPKSTGRERYGAAWLDARWNVLGRMSLEDLSATLAAYTVETVAVGLERFGVPVPDGRVPAGDAPAASRDAALPEDLVVSGGGAFNACLMSGLAARLPGVRVADSEAALGVPVLAREAVSFAVLADASLAGVPGNVPGVTGAARGVVLGKWSGA